MTNNLLDAQNVRWKLTDLFSGLSDPKIKEYLQKAQSQAEAFALQYKGKIASLKAAELNSAFVQLEEIFSFLYQVSQYANLVYSLDTSCENAKEVLDQVETIESAVANVTVFFNLELAVLPEKIYQSYLSAPELINYIYSIQNAVKNAKHNLTEPEEKVITLKDLSGNVALKKLYQEFTSAFEFEFELDGETKKLNGSQLRALRQHANPDVRRRAMKLFFSKYQQEEIIFTNLFNAIIKDYNIEKDMRAYTSAINRMNTHNDLDDSLVDLLHSVTTSSTHLVQRYYKLKAKILNLPDLSLADIYAPMPQSKNTYTFTQAKEIVLNSFAQFDPEFHDFAKLMFDQNRIDAPVVAKKVGGAYCSSSVPALKPYVLLNFLGQERDVSTMAHELGHAMHAIFSAKQTLFNYHSILPLAETASVFAEMLTTDAILKQTTDKQAKIALLTSKLEDIFATSHRQNMFSCFEQKVHKIVGQRRISATELCELYQGELKTMFGDAVQYPAEYQWEWASIPHMYEVPFYVYAYNFGNLLVLALYQSYLEQGAKFIPGYKQFLSMGSSASPLQITANIGQDITHADFWQKSIRYIESLIIQLEQLIL